MHRLLINFVSFETIAFSDDYEDEAGAPANNSTRLNVDKRVKINVHTFTVDAGDSKERTH